METRRKIKDRGETEFATNDFDAMPYAIAVMKVRPTRVRPAEC